MTPLQYIAVYGISLATFFVVDMTWIAGIGYSFYRQQLGSLLGPVNWPVAIAFYLIFLVGLFIFAISPAISAQSVVRAILYGALFGFFAYATYDLTNWSTLRDWPWLLSLVDMAWGTILSGTVSGVTTWLALTFVVR